MTASPPAAACCGTIGKPRTTPPSTPPPFLSDGETQLVRATVRQPRAQARAELLHSGQTAPSRCTAGPAGDAAALAEAAPRHRPARQPETPRPPETPSSRHTPPSRRTPTAAPCHDQRQPLTHRHRARKAARVPRSGPHDALLLSDRCALIRCVTSLPLAVSSHAFGSPLGCPAPWLASSPRRYRRVSSFETCPWSEIPA